MRHRRFNRRKTERFVKRRYSSPIGIPPGNCLVLCLILSCFLPFCLASTAQATIHHPPLKGADRAVSFWDAPLPPAMSLADSSIPVLKLNPKSFKRVVTVNPATWIITFEESYHGLRLKTPLIYHLNDFLLVRTEVGLARFVREKEYEALFAEEVKKAGKGGINIDIPVKFPKAISRIIGEGGNLKITGYRKISFSGRSEWTEGDVQTATHRPSKFPSLVMEQRSQFKIEGTIGEKIHVYVDQDSERMTELENAIRINYEGSEDEIIQEIQAGNTSLSLPSTQFVSFSSKSTGLFGIKSTAKIGPVDFVAIASQDKGSGQRKSFQAGAESEDTELQDYNYRTGYYYFIDDVYMQNYENYELNDATKKWIHMSVPVDFIVDSLEVFIDDVNSSNNAEEGARLGYAYVDPTDLNVAPGESYEGYFRRLNIDEYVVVRELGYIRLNSQLQTGKVLAVTYKQRRNKDIPRDQGGWVGNYNNDPADSTASIFKLIRPQNPRPTQSTWGLEWKNVYYLGSTNISEEGFDVRILLDKSGEEDDDSQGGDKYVTIMGLDKRNNQTQSIGPDGVFDYFDVDVVSLGRGELIFPTLRPFDTDMKFEVDTSLSIRVPQLYDESNAENRRQAHKYIIAVKTENRAASYNLGINIIEGSEVVKLNGTTLQRNKDYNIIYQIGEITFLTPDALDPAADISVDYETAPFFQPERKTLLGMRGEYTFWDDAHWGATFLYRSESMPLDRRIRLGAEPTRAVVWDSDLHLNFESQVLTDMVDALPLIRTNVLSTLKVSGEVAQSLPNSNTKGEAYVDDFDGSKNTTSLGVMRGQWTLASPPTKTSYNEIDAQFGTYSVSSMARQFYWYNPYEQVDVKEIWPKRESYAREGRTHVLAFEFTPNDSGTTSWAGVMRNMTQGNYNQSRSKYIEVWVNGNRGQVNIDMGLIDEDVIPNRRINSEDRGAESGQGDNLLDLDEDIGLDGMANGSPEAVAAGADFWDVNGNGTKEAWEPFSNDDWSYSSGSTNYTKINGTEGNRNDPDRGIRPDTEDLDGDGVLDTENSYYRYSFSLSAGSPDTIYVAGGDLDRANWGRLDSWRLYRIPLEDPTETIGQADMTNIQYMRLWVTGVSTFSRIRFATIDIVGNDWLEDGILTTPERPFVEANENFAVTVKNTHDNPDDYEPPPGVAGVIDPVTKLRQMEQSLVLKFDNMPAGHVGSASQIYTGTAKDFTNYQTLRMFVYGDVTAASGPGTGAAQFFFRFGADTSNFYEYRTIIYSDIRPDTVFTWDPRNEVHINFDELTNLKYQQVGDSNVRADTISGNFRVYGNPSLSDIRRLTVGVKSIAYRPEVAKGDGGRPLPWETVSGEVWVDELRLTDARDDPGLAGRVNVDAKLADLGAVSVKMSKVDAEFQSLGSGSTSDAQKNSRKDQSIQGSVNLNKLLPQNWGFALPFSGSYSKSTSLPKLKKGSDVILTPDEQWAQRTENTTKSASIRFSKQASSFWLLGLTLDKMTFSFSGSEKDGRSTTTPVSLNKQMTGVFSYNLSTSKDLSVSPLGWTNSKFVPDFITGTKFTLIPNSFKFDTDVSQTRSRTVDRHGAETLKFSRTTNQKLNTTMKPFGSVSTSFSLSRKLDSQNAELKKLKFGREMDRTQSAQLSYKPPILNWLGPNYSYRVNYHEKENIKVILDDGGYGRDADNSISHSVSASLNMSNFLTSLGAPKKGDKTGLLSPRWMFGMVRGLTDRFQSISGSYQKDRRSNWFNLKGRPALGFQFGADDEPGIVSDTTLTGRASTSSSGQGWNAKSGVNLLFGVSVSTGISSDYKSSISSTGQTDSKTTTFPQVSTRWGDFGKLYLIRNVVQNSSLDFSYTEKKTEEGTNNLNELYSTSTSKNFSPLCSWSATWAKSLSSSVSSNRSYTENTNLRQGNTVTTQTSSSLQASVKYSFNAPQGIKLPGLGKLKFQSNLNLNLDYKINNSKNETKNAANPITKWDKTTSIILGGSYSFSRKVKGGMKVEVSDRHDLKTNRETKVRDVGLWTEIRFD